MGIIVENKQTGETRVLDLTPTPLKSAPLVHPEHSSVLKEPIGRNQDIFYDRGYTTDGCNKSEKVVWGKLCGKTRSELPHPCWKMWKRKHQWKRQRRGYVSARILNHMGRCIYPNYWSEGGEY